MDKNFYKVVLTEYENKPTDIEEKILSKINVDFRYLNTFDESIIIQEARDADALICTWAKINSTVISEMRKCRIIVRCGIGVDNIDIEAASKAGIWVANLPDYAILEVTNHTIALILALNRKLFLYNFGIRNGLWGFSVGVPIKRIDGQTLGLIGFGNIAQNVSKKCIGLGLKVISFDPNIDEDYMISCGVVKVDSLYYLLKNSDFVSLHVPLNDSTRGIIGEKELKMMKPDAYLINTGRGGLINEPLLIKAIEEKWIAGAGLDVYLNEPISKDNKLLKLENVILTPHVAYYSEEAILDQRRMAAETVLGVLMGGTPKSFVNKNLLIKYGKNIN
ncbi:MAG: C-terminal binding protein [Actinobacteria bacterium]|nr:C-terminal binding protein [Actinomycetota bacterium]